MNLIWIQYKTPGTSELTTAGETYRRAYGKVLEENTDYCWWVLEKDGHR